MGGPGIKSFTTGGGGKACLISEFHVILVQPLTEPPCNKIPLSNTSSISKLLPAKTADY